MRRGQLDSGGALRDDAHRRRHGDQGATMAIREGETATRAIPTTRAYAAPDSASARLWERAQAVLPGGNSRTTVFMAPRPVYASEGQGCWVTDVDGERRLDLLNNYTSLIHGHAHPDITEAASRRLARGASFPMPTPEEIDLAALIAERVASVDQLRFTNSGSEAVMMA